MRECNAELYGAGCTHSEQDEVQTITERRRCMRAEGNHWRTRGHVSNAFASREWSSTSLSTVYYACIA
ncbi:hypothetical protein ZHAS_00008570 [Anopheles sinensis]|uniref:Uncharacterized protein n=1 Tax=Anopheles sinensis TaxID=74873 RepID=A0A084VT17_ANOSI|nr:hypothetical protein ZHAS_00008570 [Anopheles sinensis]